MWEVIGVAIGHASSYFVELLQNAIRILVICAGGLGIVYILTRQWEINLSQHWKNVLATAVMVVFSVVGTFLFFSGEEFTSTQMKMIEGITIIHISDSSVRKGFINALKKEVVAHPPGRLAWDIFIYWVLANVIYVLFGWSLFDNVKAWLTRKMRFGNGDKKGG